MIIFASSMKWNEADWRKVSTCDERSQLLHMIVDLYAQCG